MDLNEGRIDWLKKLKLFEARYKGGSVDNAQLKKDWDELVASYENANTFKKPILDLAGPYSWQDPDNTCKEGKGKRFYINAEYVKQMDATVGVEIDIERIRDIYKDKLIAKVPDLAGLRDEGAMKKAVEDRGLNWGGLWAKTPTKKEEEFKFAGQYPLANTEVDPETPVYVYFFQKFEEQFRGGAIWIDPPSPWR